MVIAKAAALGAVLVTLACAAPADDVNTGDDGVRADSTEIRDDIRPDSSSMGRPGQPAPGVPGTPGN